MIKKKRDHDFVSHYSHKNPCLDHKLDPGTVNIVFYGLVLCIKNYFLFLGYFMCLVVQSVSVSISSVSVSGKPRFSLN